MSRDLQFDGVEISIIKALGFGGGDISGKSLMERVPELLEAEVIDTLSGLVAMGYVESDKGTFRTSEEFEKANFHINSGYSREIRDALDPKRDAKPKSRRVRRE